MTAAASALARASQKHHTPSGQGFPAEVKTRALVKGPVMEEDKAAEQCHAFHSTSPSCQTTPREPFGV